ncbi:MAG: hypothetical protein B6241_02070 [Spirochaetaceae bacterium 4572_59]|nr:MAG: hypothetical protein B6241_02070 [Spirochaetaceae bacterium 4572_59]
MEDRWLSVDEIAEYLGVKRDTIYKWIADRGMPAHNGAVDQYRVNKASCVCNKRWPLQ